MTIAMGRLRTLAVGALLSSCLFACGGNHTAVPDARPDAAPDAAPDAPPPSPHYHYIADRILVPTSNSQAMAYGLDLNGDGTVDNQLGSVFATLAGLNIDIQANVDTAVAEGTSLLLLDIQTSDFTTAASANLQVFDGATPNPPACNAGEIYDPMTHMGCGHHLSGTGAFTIDPGSPQHAELAGAIAGGTFTSGRGELSLQLAVFGMAPIDLDLIGARVQGSNLASTTIGAGGTGGMVLAGALSQSEIDTQVLPGFTSELEGVVVRDCCGTGNATNPSCSGLAPSCGCVSSSTGQTMIGEFDTNHDCTITLDEVRNNNLIQSFLAPDLMIDTQTNAPCTTGTTCVPALSLGVHVTAVGAQFTVPGE